MRITHVVDYFHTDVGYQEYYLALTQSRAGHDVTVVTSHHRHDALGSEGVDAANGKKMLDEAGVEVIRLDATQVGHDRAWLEKLQPTLHDVAPEVIHCHHSFAPTTLRCAAAASRLEAGLLVDNHIQEAIAPGATTVAGHAYYASFRAAFGRYLRRRVGGWVANGPHEQAFLRTRMGLAAASVALVPLGFDPTIFPFDAGLRAREREQRGWSDEDTVVAVTGKMHAGKRVDLVAAACERAFDTLSIRLDLAGTIDEEDLAQARAAAPRLVASHRLNVETMLPRDALARLYLAADVVVFARLPSISIYEAAGTGAIVAVGHDEFASWLASLSPTIRPVDPHTLDLSALLHSGADDRGAAAAEAARAFSWETVSANFVRRYERLRCAS